MRKPAHSIEAVTFDVGGTLIDPWPSVGHVYAAVAARHGVKSATAAELTRRFTAAWKATKHFGYRKADWARLVDLTFAELCERPPSETFFDELYLRFEQPDAWRVYDDARPALRALRDLGLKLGIVSNWDERLLPLLERLGLLDHFSATAVSHAVGFAKPAAQIFQAVAADFRLEPARVLHVGDSCAMDFLGAQAAGMAAVWLRRGSRPAADHEISSLEDLSPRLAAVRPGPRSNKRP
jgi:putative hydrolase of the HAD superfamily